MDKRPTYEEMKDKILELKLENKALRLKNERLLNNENSLQAKDEIYRLLVQNIKDGIFSLDSKGCFNYVDEVIEARSGRSYDWFMGKSFCDITPPDYRDRIRPHCESAKKGEQMPVFEMPFPTPSGRVSWLNVYSTPLRRNGRNEGVFGIVRSITRRKKAEEKIRTSLKEKEVLLREIHHRVKNNLQIVSSLLEMTRSRTQNIEARDVLAEAKAKIYNMALIHSQLYGDKRFDEIDMEKHIYLLTDQLSYLFNKHKAISVKVDAHGVKLSVTQAIPCALVLNELISNAYKHAFAYKTDGVIWISMKNASKNRIVMRIKDSGAGIPEQELCGDQGTLGWKLVRNIVLKQLDGELKCDCKDGTDIHISFKKSI